LAKKTEKQKADLIEFRLDYFKGNKLEIEKLSKAVKIDKIATNRLKNEGGKYTGKEADRIKVLIEAAEKGFEIIDLELKTLNLKKVVKTVVETGAKPLISFHNFKETPSTTVLETIYNKEVAAKAEVCKIVTKALTPMDNIKLFNLLLKAHKKPLVCFAMGKYGVPSRILSPIFGGAFTYACINKNFKVAPGQLTIQELRKIYSLMGFI
ncbi:MAG: type I 3-dehydroquinate dehydratase, partial [Candidatus Bathyarchaeia archaeon]